MSSSATPTIAGTVLRVDARPIATRHGTFTLHVCRDLARRTYLLVLALGDVASAAPLLARVHSSCVTSETYRGCDCDCAEQLDAALAAIAAAGRGVVFYLDQEGRGAGFAAKVRDRMLVQASHGRLSTFDAYALMGLRDDVRSYDAVAGVRAVLGITAPLTLLTNNPQKLATLTELGVPIAGSTALALPPSPFNHHYLAAKADAGHALAIRPDDAEAEPPGPVAAIMPEALPSHPSLVRIGAYWLPVRTRDGGDPRPQWFRLHAYADLALGRERVVLTYGDGTRTPALVRFQREALLERIPGDTPGIEQRRWSATVRAFVDHGAGVAVMRSDESWAGVLGDNGPPAARGNQSGAPARRDDAASVVLARHHLDGREATPFLGGPAASPDDAERMRALAAAGVVLAAPRVLTLD
jgi:GTP cyclohydrolase II